METCDETTFHLIKRKVKISRIQDEQWKEEDCVGVAAIGGGGRVNFGGTATFERTGRFRIYSENTSSGVYCDILDNYLIPTVELYQMENDFLCQHDNARYHVLQQVQTKFHELGVKLLK